MKPGDLVELRIDSALVDPSWRHKPEADDPIDTAMGARGDLAVVVNPNVTGHVHLILHPVHGLREIYFRSVIPVVQG